MSKTIARFGVAVAVLALVGCSGADDHDVSAETEASESELRTSGVKAFELSKGGGMMPPLRPGQCAPSVQYRFDFASQELVTTKCRGSLAEREFTTSLSDENTSRLKKELSRVRTTARPTSCPTDVPVASLTVERARTTTRYVEARAACGGGSEAVKSLTALLTLADELTDDSPDLIGLP